jgi:hypothetical protein
MSCSPAGGGGLSVFSMGWLAREGGEASWERKALLVGLAGEGGGV